MTALQADDMPDAGKIRVGFPHLKFFARPFHLRWPLYGRAFSIRWLPKKLTAVVENQFPFITIEETGEKVPNTSPNEVMVIGTLEGGGLFSVQIEGGQQHCTGLQIDITGTEGVLRVTNPRL